MVDVVQFQPEIIQTDTILTATEGLSYRWYRNNVLVPASLGGTSRSLVVKQAGTYKVEVTGFHGCIRTTNPFNYNSSELCPNGNTIFTSSLTGTNYQWQVNSGNGFVNLTNNANYSGTNTNMLNLSFAPSSWYGYQYRCMVDGSYSNVYTLKFSNTWSGAFSTSWEAGYNWICGSAPDSNTDVTINSGTVIINSNAICRSITLNAGANLIINAGYKLTVRY